MELTTQKVKTEIIKIAEIIASGFSDEGKTNLLSICQDEGIQVIVDNYKDYFDGVLVWDGRKFNIHLNNFKGNTIDSNKGRFTLAHELGHYFIDSHREEIKRRPIPIHSSNIALSHSDKMEYEADYFAANVLMPREKLRNVTGKKKFSLDIIREVSQVFGVSLTSALVRFVEVGTHDVIVVFSQNNIVKWSVRSFDFPKLANKFTIGGPLPGSSVAGEAFLNPEAQYTTVESVDLEDWFEYRGWDPGRQLYEQCFYSDMYDYVISLIWFK